ncbi:hypothetical protein MMC17_009350 [Xylographa soralifera]|nr:hypothetical protein [Xylographa soralifera]
MSNTTDHVSMETGESENENVLEEARDESVAPVMVDRDVKLERRNRDIAKPLSAYNLVTKSTSRQSDGDLEVPPSLGMHMEEPSKPPSPSARIDDVDTDPRTTNSRRSDPGAESIGSEPDIVPRKCFFMHKERSAGLNPAEPGGRSVVPWDGPVIEIHVSVQAQPPRNRTRFRANANGWHGRVPKQPSPLTIAFVSRPQIIIQSRFILRTLNRIVGYYPSVRGNVAFDGSFPMDVPGGCAIPEPFAVLMHHFSDIESFINTNTVEESTLLNGAAGTRYDKELLQLEESHMRYLYEFLRPSYAASMIQYQSGLSEPSPRVSFDMLWCLFRPGIDVYIRTEDVIHTCVIARVMNNIDNSTEWDGPETTKELSHWVLDLWYLDTDGTRIARRQTSCKIPVYSGLRQIIRLEVCPATIWDASDGGERRRKILKQNRVHVKALNQGYLLARYDGPTTQGGRSYNGSVVVDHRRGLMYARHDAPIFSEVKDYSGHFREYDFICINN